MERKNTMFKSFKSVARAFGSRAVADREMAYLNGATDRVDLEYRQREIDRGLFSRRSAY
jgi:hypothetical protein